MSAQFDRIKAHTLQREGGLSRSKTDTASKYPAPCTFTYQGVTASDWHTNKGVQWITFKSLAPALNYSDTCKLFFEMPDSIWTKISKRIYWDVWGLDNLGSQAVANVLFQSGWGSGIDGSRKMWENVLKRSFPKNTDVTAYVAELLTKYPEKQVFDLLWKLRLDWMLSLKGQSANYEGWKKRAEILRDLSYQHIKEYPYKKGKKEKPTDNRWLFRWVIGGIAIYAADKILFPED